MVEKFLDGTEEFDGRLFTVRRDTVRLPGGRVAVREVVEHPGAVAIVPVASSGDIVMVRQFRYAVQQELLELPAGTREPGESALDCARRELEEETGYRADSFEELTCIFVSPGWCNEEIQIFRATGLHPVGTTPDEDEVLNIQLVGPGQVLGLLRDGDIRDAKSVVGLLMHRSIQ